MEISIPFGGGRNCLRKLQIWSNMHQDWNIPKFCLEEACDLRFFDEKLVASTHVSTNSWNSRHKRLVCVCACPYTVYVCFLSFALFPCWSFVENSCWPFYPRAIFPISYHLDNPRKKNTQLLVQQDKVEGPFTQIFNCLQVLIHKPHGQATLLFAWSREKCLSAKSNGSLRVGAREKKTISKISTYVKLH